VVFITSGKRDNNKNFNLLKGEAMKIAPIFLAIIAFALGSLLPSSNASGAMVLKDKEIRQTVATLINSENRVQIRDVKIKRTRDGLLDLEITTNLGNCWGKREYAREFSKEALKALFSSNLPLSYVILNVFEADKNLMTVALGKNQADNMNWDKAESLNDFYDEIKSRMNYKGNPTDYCWYIEDNPSPGP
jgi:hypothetical protein